MTEGWTLQIRPEPPTCMFANHHYRSHVYLLDSGNQLVTGVSFGLTVRLLHEDGSIASDRIMHLNSRNLSINKQGNAQFSYHFEDTSLLHGNKRFKLQVKGKGTHAFLPPAISTPIRVIRYQLQVCNSLPTEWFKDQGGRDKHMSLDVQLQDFTRQPVSIPENIPLVVSLVYEKTARPVNNQKILKLMSHTKLFVNRNGHAKIPFRIEEVSSNHQRQKFKICVAPDTNKYPLHGDIAASYSSPVTVRSKKPKKKIFHPKPDDYSMSSKRARLDRPGVTPQIGLSMKHALEQAMSSRIPPIRPAQAIQDLITWACSAQDTFRELEFQHIGYEMKSNGTMDFTRKIYRCPCCYSYGDARTSKQKHAPQCTVATMLRIYEERVGPGLGVVLRDVPAATDAYRASKQSYRPTSSVPPPASSASLAYDPTMLPKQPPRLSSAGSELLSMTTETTPLPDDGGVGRPPPKPLLTGWGDSLGWGDTGMNLSLPEATASFAVSGAVGFTPRNLAENQVHYAIASPFNTGATNLGFPGFDKAGQLKGFFQENQAFEGRGETEISFLSLDATKLSQKEINNLNASLQTQLRSNLASKSQGELKCLDDYQGDLAQMKEDISIFALKAAETTTI